MPAIIRLVRSALVLGYLGLIMWAVLDTLSNTPKFTRTADGAPVPILSRSKEKVNRLTRDTFPGKWDVQWGQITTVMEFRKGGGYCCEAPWSPYSGSWTFSRLGDECVIRITESNSPNDVDGWLHWELKGKEVKGSLICAGRRMETTDVTGFPVVFKRMLGKP